MLYLFGAFHIFAELKMIFRKNGEVHPEQNLIIGGSQGGAGWRALASSEADGRGIEMDLEVLEDIDTARALGAAAERFSADVVGIGSPTRPGFTAKIMGSIELGVLTQCRRPVLIVWPPAE